MNWQPIETAPKAFDTYLLLWEKWTDIPFIGYWNRGRWNACQTFYDTDGDACVIDNVVSINVTHWMPLPSPPLENDHV